MTQSNEVFVTEPGKDQVEVFGPEEELRAPAIDGLSAKNLTPSSTELRAQIDPRRRRNRISLPVRHERLHEQPHGVHGAPRRQDRRRLRRPERERRGGGPAAGHGVLLPPAGEQLSGQRRKRPGCQHVHDVALAERAARRPRLGDGLPAGKAWRRRSKRSRNRRAGSIQAAGDGSCDRVVGERACGQRTGRQPQLRTDPAALDAAVAKNGARRALKRPTNRAGACCCPRRASTTSSRRICR